MIRSTIKKIIKTILGNDSSDAPTSPSPTPQPKQEPVPADNGPANAEKMANIECTVQEMIERIDCGEPLTIIDVREVFELQQTGTLPNARHIPLRELPSKIKDLQNENEIICYCAMGGRSLNAAMLLRDNGLFNATSMSGGITAWRNYGGQTEPYTET